MKPRPDLFGQAMVVKTVNPDTGNATLARSNSEDAYPIDACNLSYLSPVDSPAVSGPSEPTKEEAQGFQVLDSGQRAEFESGMVRDTEEGKVDYTLVLDGPILDRYAAHLTKGAKKYSPRNWMLATGEAELERFRRSAIRHFFQWLRGERDEDHAAAVVFNLNGAEYVRAKLESETVKL